MKIKLLFLCAVIPLVLSFVISMVTDKHSIFYIFYFIISVSCIWIVLETKKAYRGQPASESTLRKYSNKRFKVESSLYAGKNSDNKFATLFSCTDNPDYQKGNYLVYCHTSYHFNVGDIVDITYSQQDNTLKYEGKDIFMKIVL